MIRVPDQAIGLVPFVVLPLAIVIMTLLAGCGAVAPDAFGRTQEPGFSAFCAAHPHHGTCP
ncbi:MAG TPA: hypothetical protein VHY35_13735 [Stellaceae bacterium]|jgi:hypothetical protein|nr:hypothetical protein [Stellaceae bacterium]